MKKGILNNLLFILIMIIIIPMSVSAKSQWIQRNGKIYCIDSDTNKTLQWWHSDEKGSFYLQRDGSVIQGLQNINGIMYYVENNYIYHGEKEINGKTYVFDNVTGELKSGPVRLSNGSLVLIRDNATYTNNGWIEYKGNNYYVIDGHLLEEFNKVGNKTYYFEKNTGRLLQWWHSDEKGSFYLQRDGSVIQGLQNINGIMYYVENNYIYHGEKEINGKTYVFDNVTGELKSGPVRLSNGSLVLIRDNATYTNNGWIEYKGNKYYVIDGHLLEGFNKVGNKTYYFEKNTGRLLQWWHSDEKGSFYLQRDGSVIQGLQNINGIMYYVENNYIYHGEKEINGKTYVFDNVTGELKSGPVRLSNGSLVLIRDNATYTNNGWIEYKGNKYYVIDGHLLEGFNKVGNKTYYFEKNTGRLLQWWHSDEKGSFYLQRDGSVIQGLQNINGIMYYVENNYIYHGEKEINGKTYVFDNVTGELKSGPVRLSNGSLVLIRDNATYYPVGWENYNKMIYYVKSDFTLATKNNTIEGRNYYFGEDGILWGFYWQDGKMYYNDPDGKRVYGVQRIAGNYYQFNEFSGAFEKMVYRKNVIDVSKYQGNIDWNVVKNSGQVDGVILRIGFGSNGIDSSFYKNVNALNSLGIPYGIYLFSYAENGNEAEAEANNVISILAKTKFNISDNLGVFYDLEDWSIPSVGANSYGISKDSYHSMIITFCSKINNKLNLSCGIYASKNYIINRFYEYDRPYVRWVSEWSNSPTYSGTYIGWQYTSDGTVHGITGRVDKSIFYY